MTIPLMAMASQCGALFSNSKFLVPKYQREYSWSRDEILELFNDFKNNIDSGNYFLGLVIFTEKDKIKHIVDGQQRILTITLLAKCLFNKSNLLNRKALANKISSDFLYRIDFDTDEYEPRIVLSSEDDDNTMQTILKEDKDFIEYGEGIFSDNSCSPLIIDSYNYIMDLLNKDLKENDNFKRLGQWVDFISNYLYFAIFIHPNQELAYQVFEVINTRGKELTTVDLLKNHLMKESDDKDKDFIYDAWMNISKMFKSYQGDSNFIQFIRHTITYKDGYILPKDLYSYISSRSNKKSKNYKPHLSPMGLLEMLMDKSNLYMNMIDQSGYDPISERVSSIFSAFNNLNVISIRPILIALFELSDDEAIKGMENFLKLIFRRIIVGNLGTGNVERRLGDAAKKIREQKSYLEAFNDLRDLNPSREEFVDKINKRSYNKGILNFLKESINQVTLTPEVSNKIIYVLPKNSKIWTNGENIDDGEKSYLGCVGNTVLSILEKKPTNNGDDWRSLQKIIIDSVTNDLDKKFLGAQDEWTCEQIKKFNEVISEEAANVWY